MTATTSELPAPVAESLIEAAIDGRDREICGFVMPEWNLVFMPNVAEKAGNFEMDEGALWSFYTEFPKPLGIFHSHPNGREEPSNVDFDYAPAGLRYWIIVPSTRTIVEWDMSRDKPCRVA